jgi:hypothetical protein
MGSSVGESGIDSFIIFLDENHCRNPHLLQALEEAGVRFESHLNHFEPGTEDTAWLPEVGASWLVSSHHGQTHSQRSVGTRSSSRPCCTHVLLFNQFCERS